MPYLHSADLTPFSPYPLMPVKPTRLASLLRLSMLASTALQPVLAEEAAADEASIERIVVTAEKRSATLLEVPASLSALTLQDLQDKEVTSITEIGLEVPNLHIFSWGGRRDSNVFIRGIGPGLFTEPTVGFYVDGVSYASNSIFDMDLVDVERVEVLRGPQGTLYGGNSLAGVINIITREPGDTTEGRLSASASNLHEHRVNASVMSPLVADTLLFSAAVSAVKGNGYLYNTALDRSFGKQDDHSGRAKLRWNISDTFFAQLALDYEHFRGDSYAMGLLDAIEAHPDQVNHDFAGVDNRDAVGSSLTLNWQGQQVDMIAITSWRDWENFNSADQDTASLPDYSYISQTDEELRQLSQEIRWSAKADANFHWLFGLYGYNSKADAGSRNDLLLTAAGMGGPYIDLTATLKKNQGYAAFGQIDYALTPQLKLTTGLRLDKEQREARVRIDAESKQQHTEFAGDKDFNEWLPKIALSYTTQSQALWYASASKGYRAGGFDTIYPNTNKPTYDSETSNNFELGYKASLWQDQLSVSMAAFYIDLKNQQIQQLLPDNSIITDNAGKSRSQGLELETRFKPDDHWTLEFAASYTDASFQQYQSINFATFATEDYQGNRLPNTPKFSANLTLQHRWPLGNQLELFSQLADSYVGSHYFDPANSLQQDAYHLLNAKVGVEGQSWSAYLWAKNALDRYYSKVEFNFGFGTTAEAGKPRAVGVTFNWFF